MNRHLRLAGHALWSLRRSWWRSFAVLVVYTSIVAVSSSLLLYVTALRVEVRRLLADGPALIVQRLTAGRHDLIPAARAAEIGQIRGVRAVQPRVWGYTYDPPSRATLTLWGAESAPLDGLQWDDGGLAEEGSDFCVVGAGVADGRFLDIGDRLPLRAADGSLHAPRVTGIFRASSSILTHDLVVMPSDRLREIFSVPANMAVDLVVDVPQRREVDTVARKIQERWGDTRTISREQVLRTYDAVFDWRGGLWLAIILGSVAAFMILVWDKASGMSAEEYREVGLLKATGWKSRDVMELKLLEAGILSLVALTTGVFLGQLHVVLLDGVLFARILKGWSVVFPRFDLHPTLDSYAIAASVLLTVVPFLLSSLVPAWRAAITDPDRILRS